MKSDRRLTDCMRLDLTCDPECERTVSHLQLPARQALLPPNRSQRETDRQTEKRTAKAADDQIGRLADTPLPEGW